MGCIQLSEMFLKYMRMIIFLIMVFAYECRCGLWCKSKYYLVRNALYTLMLSTKLKVKTFQREVVALTSSFYRLIQFFNSITISSNFAASPVKITKITQ